MKNAMPYLRIGVAIGSRIFHVFGRGAAASAEPETVFLHTGGRNRDLAKFEYRKFVMFHGRFIHSFFLLLVYNIA